MQTFEWTGTVFGLLGAFLLATNSRVSRYGWLAFLVANFAMTGLAIGINANGLLIQQIGFTAMSLLGLYRAGMWPSICRT
ncbi:hypothetical protein RA876_19340 (plasmid) [Rhodoferax antarcticus]|nr:hypothetical protein RA876_19340 [Rhodoferax antarcticus]